MKVYEGLDSLPPRLSSSAVTIGNYDGVHRGHQAVIRRLHSRAASTGGAPTVVTFDPHPQTFLHGEAPPALATHQDKIELLRQQNIERLCVLRFDSQLASMEPERFIEEVLVQRLKAACVVVGSNFRFGRFARGDTVMLRRYGKHGLFKFEAVRISRIRGRTVSSTEIRHAITEGDVGWANLALGRPFHLSGQVVKGKGRGRQIGIPTANLAVPTGICMPATGIYGGWVTSDDGAHVAAISVGTNPTFGTNPVTVEAHLIDADVDLYGQQVKISFESFIRKEKKFSSVQSLIKAIEKDIAAVRSDSSAWSSPDRSSGWIE